MPICWQFSYFEHPDLSLISELKSKSLKKSITIISIIKLKLVLLNNSNSFNLDPEILLHPKSKTVHMRHFQIC